MRPAALARPPAGVARPARLTLPDLELLRHGAAPAIHQVRPAVAHRNSRGICHLRLVRVEFPVWPRDVADNRLLSWRVVHGVPNSRWGPWTTGGAITGFIVPSSVMATVMATPTNTVTSSINSFSTWCVPSRASLVSEPAVSTEASPSPADDGVGTSSTPIQSIHRPVVDALASSRLPEQHTPSWHETYSVRATRNPRRSLR